MKGFLLFIVIFSITMMSGALWEIWEFVTDLIMDGNSQKFDGFIGQEALKDTMLDIIADAIGGILGSLFLILLKNKNLKHNDT